MRSLAYAITNVREAPIVLSHVSSHWRAVSIATPTLWDWPRFTEFTVPPPLAFLMRPILERSRHLPVSVTFDTSTSRARPPSELPEGTIHGSHWHVLGDLHDRLQSVSLVLGRWDLRRFDIWPPRKVLTVLTSLDIRMDDDQAEYLAAILAFFGNAPSLRCVALDAYCLPVGSRQPPFPWAQLTSLTISIPMDNLNAHEILIQCTHLQTCTFSEMNDSDDEWQARPVCTLRALHSFGFSPWNASSAELLIPFSFPSLASRSLSGCESMSFTVLLDLHTRSQFELRHLELSDLQITAEELLAFLRRLQPTLQTLALADSDCIMNTLFEMFTYHPDLHSHLPSLSPPSV